MPRFHASPRASAILILVMSGGVAMGNDAPTFERDVRPILKAYCLDCHGAGEEVSGNLDLRLRRFALRGGDSGPALQLGKSAESLLVQRLRDGEMPPGEKKVPPEKIAVIARWIDAGAVAKRQEPESLPAGIDITPEERSFWAFQPIRRLTPPAFGPDDRVRTPIDAWILAKLQAQGLRFNPDADRLTLIRRAAFDVTGLPPTPEEMTAFLADDSEAAYERMIDRLLDSPHYGERWARHWLDVAGYADSDGDGTNDTVRPYAWKYRDYVIRSLNEDKPLDQFVIEQLAGDELVPRPAANLTSEQIELLTATGFLRMAADPTAAGGDQAINANQVIADQIKIVSSSLLGLTVGCAQCHDHRYDPIPQSDYYRLRAVFEPAWNWTAWRPPGARLVSLMTDAQRAELAKVEVDERQQAEVVAKKQKEWIDKLFEIELSKFPEADRPTLSAAFKAPADQRTAEQKKLVDSNPKLNITAGVIYQYSQPAADEIKKLNDELDRIRRRKPVADYIHALVEDPGISLETKLFHRGDHRQPKQPVGPGDLTIAGAEGARFEVPAKDAALPTNGRRLAYARHLMSGRHPLVGRVLANRIWLHHFGRGLVETPGDFGALGVPPTHPELLDWLASEGLGIRVEGQGTESSSATVTSVGSVPRPSSRGTHPSWSLKRLHRLILTSTVYRQSSRRSSQQDSIDSENRLLARYPVQRLDAEILRDRLLAASGKLDTRAFGPAEALREDSVGQVVADTSRRSVYLQVRRSRPVSFLAAFDAPLMAVNCDRRVASTTAPQSLMLMNSEFVVSQAAALAERVRRETRAGYERELTEPLRVQYPRPGGAWQFGYGSYRAESKRIEGFTALSHWTGSAWQGGATLPDPATGWVILHAAGGHAGSDAAHAAVRRWTAPRPGRVAVAGKLKHATTCGDGVRGRIVSSRSGLHGEFVAAMSESATEIAAIEVQAGDTLDFAVDCLENVNCDSFEWNVQLRMTDAAGAELLKTDSAAEFHGPLGATLPELVASAWQLAYQRAISPEELVAACEFCREQDAHLKATGATGDHELAVLTNLCQQLLDSNEFLYID